MWARAVHDNNSSVCQAKSGETSIKSIESISSIPQEPPTYPEIASNGALALIAVATSLLDRQLAAQSKYFLEEGGFTERLHRIRTERRQH